MGTRKITVREFVEDVRSGMGDSELMNKYALSEKQLFEVYDKLLESKKLTPEDLEKQASGSDPTQEPPATCPECGYSKMSASDLCPRCGAGESLTVVDHGAPRPTLVSKVPLGLPLDGRRLTVEDTQVIEAMLDVSRTARVHPEWVAPSGEYDIEWHMEHAPRTRKRLLTAKQWVYLALGAGFLGVILFLGLEFYEDIQLQLRQWWRGAPSEQHLPPRRAPGLSPGQSGELGQPRGEYANETSREFLRRTPTHPGDSKPSRLTEGPILTRNPSGMENASTTVTIPDHYS